VIAASVLTVCVIAWRSRRGSDGFGRYMLVAAVVSAVVLTARFGVHARCRKSN